MLLRLRLSSYLIILQNYANYHEFDFLYGFVALIFDFLDSFWVLYKFFSKSLSSLFLLLFTIEWPCVDTGVT